MSSRALVADAQSSPASEEARRLAHIRALKAAETRSVLEEGDYWGWLLARLRLTSHKVLLTVVPLVLLTVLVRVLLQVLTRGEFSSSPDAAGFQGIFAAETVTPFTTASMFVIALMLSGVMEDYKESEKIPAEIACALDSLSSKACYVEHVVAAKLHELREEREEEEAHARKHGEHAPAAAADGASGGRYFRRQLRELDNLAQFDGAQVHTELARYTECLCVPPPQREGGAAPARTPARARWRLTLPLSANASLPFAPPPHLPSPPRQHGVLCQDAQLPGHYGHHQRAAAVGVRQVPLRGGGVLGGD